MINIDISGVPVPAQIKALKVFAHGERLHLLYNKECWLAFKINKIYSPNLHPEL